MSKAEGGGVAEVPMQGTINRENALFLYTGCRVELYMKLLRDAPHAKRQTGGKQCRRDEGRFKKLVARGTRHRKAMRDQSCAYNAAT